MAHHGCKFQRRGAGYNDAGEAILCTNQVVGKLTTTQYTIVDRGNAKRQRRYGVVDTIVRSYCEEHLAHMMDGVRDLLLDAEGS